MIEGSALQDVVGLVFVLSSELDVRVIRHLLFLLFGLLLRRLGLGLPITVRDAWRESGRMVCQTRGSRTAHGQRIF